MLGILPGISIPPLISGPISLALLCGSEGGPDLGGGQGGIVDLSSTAIAPSRELTEESLDRGTVRELIRHGNVERLFPAT
jgi:hypothetical protein